MLMYGTVRFERPTLLIVGTPSDYMKLHENLSVAQDVKITSAQNDSAQIKIIPQDADHPGSLFFEDNGSFVWHMSDDERGDVLGKLVALGRATSGHHFLDPIVNQTDYDIVASVGEYDRTVYEADS